PSLEMTTPASGDNRRLTMTVYRIRQNPFVRRINIKHSNAAAATTHKTKCGRPKTGRERRTGIDTNAAIVANRRYFVVIDREGCNSMLGIDRLPFLKNAGHTRPSFKRSRRLNERCQIRIASAARLAKSSFRNPGVISPLGRTKLGPYLDSESCQRLARLQFIRPLMALPQKAMLDSQPAVPVVQPCLGFPL